MMIRNFSQKADRNSVAYKRKLSSITDEEKSTLSESKLSNFRKDQSVPPPSVIPQEIQCMMSTHSRKRSRNGHDNGEDSTNQEEPPIKRAPLRTRSKCRTSSTVSTSRETCTSPAPLSYMEACQIERDSIDYSIKITEEMAAADKAGRPVRVYADGIYDMFHSGHARQLMQAKTCFPNVYLLVGVCSDDLTHQEKGRTVMNEEERYEAIRHCRYVDEIVPDAPWTLTEEYLSLHKIDFVAHDDIPYAGEGHDDVYKDIKAKGMFVATNRTEGISTTDVISRIIKDYDLYIRRNLSRGYTAKELNVSYMREKKLQIQEKVDLMKHKGREIVEKIDNKTTEIMNKWEEKSREFMDNFLDLFGKEGRINQWINTGRKHVARAISPVSSPSREGTRSPSPDYFLTAESNYSPPTKKSRLSAAAGSEEDLQDSDEDLSL